MHICIDIYGHPHGFGVIHTPIGGRTFYACCADLCGNLDAKTACAVDFYTGAILVTNSGDLIVKADGDIAYRPDGKVKQIGRWSVEYRPDGKIHAIDSDVFEYGQGVMPVRIGGCKKGAIPPKEPEILRYPNGLLRRIGDCEYEYTNGKLTRLGGDVVLYRDDGKLLRIGWNVLRYSNNGFIIGTLP